ncbi:helix-turn-helix domain-containing protein [Onishia niordana]|uniref:helix-turn-helix domain-containing protein n=1 Tax=Onishia niordana TaxID=2508711 RepID=UPI001F106F30|nr:helix-turn-helix domain-containing protein [Halomonas niordiana]
METSNTPQVPATVPVMTIERFAELTGLSPDTIRRQLQQGNLPIAKIGRRRLVNVALLTAECLISEDWA